MICLSCSITLSAIVTMLAGRAVWFMSTMARHGDGGDVGTIAVTYRMFTVDLKYCTCCIHVLCGICKQFRQQRWTVAWWPKALITELWARRFESHPGHSRDYSSLQLPV